MLIPTDPIDTQAKDHPNLRLALFLLFACGPACAANSTSARPATLSDARPFSLKALDVSNDLEVGIEGTVLDPSGRPVAGAVVLPQAIDDNAGPIPDMAVVTGPNGRFAWPLTAGRYRLRVLVDGRVSGSAVVTVHRGEAASVTIKLTR